MGDSENICMYFCCYKCRYMRQRIKHLIGTGETGITIVLTLTNIMGWGEFGSLSFLHPHALLCLTKFLKFNTRKGHFRLVIACAVEGLGTVPQNMMHYSAVDDIWWNNYNLDCLVLTIMWMVHSVRYYTEFTMGLYVWGYSKYYLVLWLMLIKIQKIQLYKRN
jgi:hypothetical protein